MVKLAEAILKKKNEFGPLSAEFMKNARATSRDKATSLSMESIVSTSSNGKRKSIDEDVPKEELPAKKKGKKTLGLSKEVEPVEQKTRKKKAEKKVEEKSQDEGETTPKAKSKKKKDTEAPAPAPATKRVTRTRSASIAEHLSKATLSEPQPKSISSTTKALPKPKRTASPKKSKKPSPSPEPEQEEDDEKDEEEVETEKEAEFFGFSTDDDGDSSDEDDLNEAPPLDVTKLPTIAKDDATVKRKLEQAKKKPVSLLKSADGGHHIDCAFLQTEDRGVIYLGRIPHGFYEDQMKSYFTQFGDVTRLRLSRNKRVSILFILFVTQSLFVIRRLAAQNTMPSSSSTHLLSRKLWPRPWITTSSWVTSSLAKLSQRTKYIPNSGSERIGSGELYRILE